MSSRARIELGIQFPHERLPEFTNKAGISIRDNDFRNTMKSIIIVNKKVCCLFNIDFLVTWNKMSHFLKVAYQDQNSGVLQF
jgi:hypothetical protein